MTMSSSWNSCKHSWWEPQKSSMKDPWASTMSMIWPRKPWESSSPASTACSLCIRNNWSSCW
ncbi:hypothetical protein LEMLEM_LOCUS2899 [Lemmus lemmus]